MTINLSNKIGSGGSWEADFHSKTQVISSGATGDITINCPADKRIRLTMFYKTSGNDLGGVSIRFGARTLVDGSTVASVGSSVEGSNYFRLGYSSYSGVNAGNTNGFLQGKKNENLVINFAVAVIGEIIYAYETGD